MDNIQDKITNIFKTYQVDINNVDSNKSLIESGIIDSMAFANILLEIEDVFGIELDFEHIDMVSITSVTGLIEYIKTVVKQ